MSATNTMTRADLSESLHRNIGLSRAESSKIVDSILEHMISSLANGEHLKITGFGTFTVREKAERIGRNPKTGVEVPIAPRKVLSFRPSQQMREKVAGAVS
jgi:integration host factor subunit alpha